MLPSCIIIDKYYINGENYKPVTKPYFNGWKTGIRIGCYSGSSLYCIGTISSGLTDELREEFSTHPEKYINKVIEINCMDKENKEKTLRHGYFKCFREDKNPSECTIQSIFN